MSRSVVIAGIITLAVVAWVLSGQFGGAVTQDAATPATATQGSQRIEGVAATSPSGADASPSAPKPRVRIETLIAEQMVNEIELQGRTESDRTVELRAEVGGKIVEVLAQRGARVRAGQGIVRLDVADRDVDLNRAKALLAQREIEFTAARSLNRQGFQTEVRLAEATAELDAARAEVRRAELALERTLITAPFDGVLNTRTVELGDVIEPGGRIGTVLDLDPIKVVGFVSERSVIDLKLGQAGRARILGQPPIDGRIGFIAAAADPATRTFRVELDVPNPDGTIVDGLTAQLRLPLTQQSAHRVPPSILTLADDGTLGVKIVGANDRVAFMPVRILDDAGNGRVWVEGLPPTARAITVGQEFVAVGQPVTPVEAGSVQGAQRGGGATILSGSTR